MKKATYNMSGSYGSMEDGTSFTATDLEVFVDDDGCGNQKMYAAPPPGVPLALMVTGETQAGFFAKDAMFGEQGTPASDVDTPALHKDGVALLVEKNQKLDYELKQKKWELIDLKKRMKSLEKMNVKLMDRLFQVIDKGIEKLVGTEEG